MAFLLSLALPSAALAEPRTPACDVFAEADSWDWPTDSTCGRLLPAPEPVSEEEAEAVEEVEATCPIACRFLDPMPAPELKEGEEAAPEPCGEDAGLCIASKANPAHRDTDIDLSLFRKPDQEETAPPTPPPARSHKHGLTHAFDWVKALNTCRTQTAAAIPRPEKPRKNEFESSATFSGRQSAYGACQDERESEVIKRQSLIEPVLEEATFYAILRADSIGDYNADEGCFFPGITARVELDDFKSKDAVYLNHYAAADSANPISDPKRRLIPRDSELRVELTSGTIASVALDPDSERTVLLLTSHPVCVSADKGREDREQSELNGIVDFGIQAELMLNFRFEVGPDPADPRETIAWPVWVVDGDFIYRNDPTGTTLTVEPGREAPVVAEDGSRSLNLGRKDSACATVSGSPARAAALLALFALVGLRRRR